MRKSERGQNFDSLISDMKIDFSMEKFLLRLPGIDRLQEFILHKGGGCYIHKKDFKRAYQQFPTDPKDYKYLIFQ